MLADALLVTNNSTNVQASVRMKQTFEIVPQFASPADASNDAFDPASPEAVARRFAAPTNFSVNILQTSFE